MATTLKSTLSGLQFCRSQYLSVFIRLAVVAAQICEIPRKFGWGIDSLSRQHGGCRQ